MKWWPSDPMPGDMVRVSIGSVKHYGIFISENEIIQFGPPPVALNRTDNSSICVCTATADEFSCGNIIETAVLEKSEERRRIPREKTVAEARKRLGEKGYNLLHNNCEHFAYECVFGSKHSTQEEQMRQKWNSRPILDMYIAPVPEKVSGPAEICDERKKQIESTSDPLLRDMRLYGWEVLMYAASRSMNLDPSSLSFKRSGSGKWSCGEMYFSLAYARGAAVVAVSNGKVGTDAENEGDFLGRNYGSGKRLEKEFRKYSRASGKDADPSPFIEEWVRRESAAKAYSRMFYGPKKGKALSARLSSVPGIVFAVSGEKLESARFYLYENGTARPVNSEIIKSESCK